MISLAYNTGMNHITFPKNYLHSRHYVSHPLKWRSCSVSWCPYLQFRNVHSAMARTLTGPIASANTVGLDHSLAFHEIGCDAPIFSTGLLIPLPAAVEPLVGVDGIGRIGAADVPFFADASNLIFGFADSAEDCRRL